jgi:hypothetical protein
LLFDRWPSQFLESTEVPQERRALGSGCERLGVRVSTDTCAAFRQDALKQGELLASSVRCHRPGLPKLGRILLREALPQLEQAPTVLELRRLEPQSPLLRGPGTDVLDPDFDALGLARELVPLHFATFAHHALAS